MAELGGALELGAQYYHGCEGNPAYALAASLGLLKASSQAATTDSDSHGVDRAPRSLHLRSDGEQMTNDDIASSHEAWRVLCEAVSQVEDGDPCVDHGASFGDHVRAAWQRARPLLLAKAGRDARVLDAAWRNAEKLQCAIDGCGDLAEQSAGQAYANYDEFDGRNVISRPDLGGFSALLDSLAAPLRAREGSIVLNAVARTIDWNGADASGASVAGSNGVATPSPVHVVCEDGRAFSADAVCVTAALAPLRAIEFTPPLPDVNSEALASLSLGGVEKVFVAVEPESPSAPPMPSLKLLWTDGGDGRSAAAAAASSSSWVRGLYDLHCTRQQADENGSGNGVPRAMLIGWLTGDDARKVSGRPAADLLREVTDGLAPFWRQIPGGWRPVACHATGWCSDRNFGGSYSFPRPGATADVTQKLSAPLTAVSNQGEVLPRVCFAGEATSMDNFGTVGGAMLSGEREAKRLLRAWQDVDSRVSTVAS